MIIIKLLEKKRKMLVFKKVLSVMEEKKHMKSYLFCNVIYPFFFPFSFSSKHTVQNKLTIKDSFSVVPFLWIFSWLFNLICVFK